jgi:hypothetical protein
VCRIEDQARLKLASPQVPRLKQGPLLVCGFLAGKWKGYLFRNPTPLREFPLLLPTPLTPVLARAA